MVSVREDGLPPGAAVTLVVTADATARYYCPPLLAEPVTAQASGLLRAHADLDGTLAAAIRVHPPSAGGLGCASGSRPTSAAYTNVVVSDVTDRVRAPLAGEFDGTA